MFKKWRTILGYEKYEVSDTGLIRCLVQCGRLQQGTLLKQTINNPGYAVCSLSGKQFRVHRLVCLAFNGPPTESKPLALHKDGNKNNNTPDNLYWGDTMDNQKDSTRHGTVAKGTKNGKSVLNEEKVGQIRSDTMEGRSKMQIAKDLGVSRGAVRDVLSGRNWSWVTAEPSACK